MKLKKVQLISNASLGLLIKDVVEKKCAIRIKATGCSMRPSILSNDIITISPYLNLSSSTGDIAAFIHPATGRVLVHRIIKENGSFMFKGDNRISKDGWVDQNNILGFVGKVQRGEKVFLFEPGKEKQYIIWLSRLNIFFAISLFAKISGTLFALHKTRKTIKGARLWKKIKNLSGRNRN
ncbi:putative signal sequence peptidase [Desulforapulum autotrophicum HRM2]|uniref:Signal sequence peptidase n=1 Tax=Desulforapulum autotrophicum (strain ATCC 43914 / DSM 3382 / VKM B-1955 / HRM2) TaxID=177437 RepID=C0QGZ6_DESAH|nr:S24 family peptidase [Desulforapulum autotrophicum]ACN15645.1 putative signal sequence peptidase [Desulforapulum autotrophicum HRM2]